MDLEQEEDGRILASVPELPGVMAYGATEEEAARNVKSIALQVLADMIESAEDVPEPQFISDPEVAGHQPKRCAAASGPSARTRDPLYPLGSRVTMRSHSANSAAAAVTESSKSGD